ncbi:hypothetical protein BDN71DRAFT_1454812 [Pleurotus eryngii]|uniref:Uncharacterized protein n=1 Tax=Pleurotus eryngii TaxID=5323 RepID=A0A9P5ZLF0_PLEER|nr:hypothetical protein BDN71DRAFT_1454812 [Pleurotus eryngii]
MYKPARCERSGPTALLFELSPSAVLPLHSPEPYQAARVQSEVCFIGVMTKRRVSCEYGVEDLEVAGLTIGSGQVQFTTCISKVVIIS